MNDALYYIIGLGVILIGIIRSLGGLNVKLADSLSKAVDERTSAEDERLAEKEARLKLQEKLLSLESKQVDQLRKIEFLERDNIASSEVLKRWEKRITDLETENTRLTSELEKAVNELGKSGTDKTELERRISKFEDELDALRNERDTAIRERDEAREQLKREIEKTAVRLDALETQNRLEDVPLKAKTDENPTPLASVESPPAETVGSGGIGGSG